MQVNILEAKNRLSELVRAVQAGESVVLANRGKPVARLVPLQEAASDAQGGVAAWLVQHPLPAHAQRSAAEIEADLSTERGAWD